jgi:hypothetical protein
MLLGLGREAGDICFQIGDRIEWECGSGRLWEGGAVGMVRDGSEICCWSLRI